MVFTGIGAGINELTALAATAEMAPTRKRGTYVAILVFTIVPFCPSVLWSQLIANHSSWRYIGLLCGIWAGVGVLLTFIFYFPPPRVNSAGLSGAEILRKIDWIGGLLSISGTVLFLMGLQWGGHQVCSFEILITVRAILTYSVLLEIGPYSCSSFTWYQCDHSFLHLGGLRRQIPHVPSPSPTGSTRTFAYVTHYLDIRCKFLLHPHVLAYGSLQRVWS